MDVYIHVMELMEDLSYWTVIYLLYILVVCVGVDPVICSSIYYCINLIPYEGNHTY